jgi:hypothetical protein
MLPPGLPCEPPRAPPASAASHPQGLADVSGCPHTFPLPPLHQKERKKKHKNKKHNAIKSRPPNTPGTAAVKSVLSEYRIHNADVHLKQDYDVDELIDVIEGSRVYIPW